MSEDRLFDDNLLTQKVFLEGPAGCGKTTFATRYLLRLLERGAQPDRILLLVPQPTLGRPYQLALHESPTSGGMVNIMTIATLARRAAEVFWPLVAASMGFSNPDREPTFLNIETAQYFMARIAKPAIERGEFHANDVTMTTPRIISQILDNLNRAALMQFSLGEIPQRLAAAWGPNRDSARPRVYDAAAQVAQDFRQHCLQNNVLDFSLVMEAFIKVLLPDPRFAEYLGEQVDFLIADNIEEDNPAAHDFMAWLLPHVRGALMVYDTDGGYRIFLGADPDNALALQAHCDVHLPVTESFVMSPELTALGHAINRKLGPQFVPAESPGNPRAAFTYAFHRYYPQMIDWVVDEVVKLIVGGVSSREIAIVAPFLGDSLRFSLNYQIAAKAAKAGITIETLSHRPSRALREEPSTRAMLTFSALAHPEWQIRPPSEDVADALAQAIEGLDPVRARLLTDIVYRKRGESPSLSSFARINAEMQKRISYLAGERYEALREWIDSYKAQTEHEGYAPLDHFLRRLFGELLSQPGYGFHTNLEAGRIIAQLIASAQQFRRALYPGENEDWKAAGKEYIDLVNARLLPALFAQSWQDEESDAVFMAPVSTFLLRNRFVDYQFWLDIGSSSWAERLEQPLTHPYVLRREYSPEAEWTDDLEEETKRATLYRLTVGLVRRCRKQIYLGIADLGESGFEQRGYLLHVFQQVLQSELPEDQPAAGEPEIGDTE